MDNKPNPGSDEALALGCTCPVIANARGKGIMGGVRSEGHTMFNHCGSCPVHGQDAANVEEEES